ncbi:NADH-ubiquinone oxidoreductase chain L [hydrothermal vent metagenome]|uniref:NADH-ubiquinone oxidoreductase chain L n=1 Tax=hydrothermal vent metagenome TaxID=652676 RepID=A0A3B1C3Y5_9ZZZZ
MGLTWGLENIWLVPILPLLGSIINGVFGRYLSKPVIGAVACGSTGFSFFVAILAFAGLISQNPAYRVYENVLFTWIESGSFVAEAGIQLDPLSGVWLLIVTGVGFLIHVYSIGYMRHEDGYPRYFSYLNLFMFSMLLLILGNNFLLMFIGWEGVGLCSYLLIGYYYDKDSAADAGKKAFIMNRVGDFGFLLAIMWIFTVFGSIDYTTVFPSANATLEYGGFAVTGITLLLFLGAVGKSAQVPLYTWLPDAMEGPTPVSALIHAATMVTAGVYMVCRCAVLFNLAPVSMVTVAMIGAFTAVFAATMGLYQNDIKRVLAYSTVSQLGYMFLACGVGAYVAAVFHVMTHAFFKACLFLGSGSVIHGMSGEQDMRQMGGLKDKMPVTHMTFLISTLAISGIPLFAGFFSKDEILLSAFIGHTSGHLFFWFLAIMAAALTAFYMFRLYYMTFSGELRAEDKHVRDHVHESPYVMTVPLAVLAFLAVIGGFFGFPIIKGAHALNNFMAPMFNTVGAPEHPHPSLMVELVLMGLSVGVAVAGILTARYFYQTKPEAAEAMAKKEGLINKIYVTMKNKYYIDELYDALFVNPAVRISRNFLWKIFDVKIIDGFVNALACMVKEIGSTARLTQTGLIRNYALAMVAGCVFLVGFWFLAIGV